MTTSIAKAKAQFSRWVARARRGEEIIITDRGKPVAKIAPLGTADIPLTPHQLDMVRDGRLRLPKERATKKWVEEFLRRPLIKVKGGVLQALLDEREEDYQSGYR